MIASTSTGRRSSRAFLQRLADHRVGVEHVHAVAAHAGHAEALAAAVQVGDRGVALDRGAHAELVVRDHEDDRQAPEGGEVERLAERALVGGAVAEHAQRDLFGAAVVGGQRHARGEREVAADDPVAAHEAVLEVEHVHRAAAAVRDARLAAEQLGHDLVGIRAARQRVAVRAVGRDQVVLVAHRADGADDRRLLADGEVEEATDLRLRVHLARPLLEAADEHHRLEPLARGVALRQLALRGPFPLLLGYVSHGSRTLARDSRRSRTRRARTRHLGGRLPRVRGGQSAVPAQARRPSAVKRLARRLTARALDARRPRGRTPRPGRRLGLRRAPRPGRWRRPSRRRAPGSPCAGPRRADGALSAPIARWSACTQATIRSMVTSPGADVANVSRRCWQTWSTAAR